MSASLRLLFATVLFSVTLAGPASEQWPLDVQTTPLNGGGHSIDAVHQNAPHIFNTLHSSMRQWGSSLRHNGMSYFTASIPANTLLYHGTNQKDAVTGMEWLAFEIEHAEMFARSRGPPGKGNGPGGPKRPGNPKRGHDPEDKESRERQRGSPVDGGIPGYLHVYQTTRELTRLLYIDGMSAGKTNMGTLDTTDIVLRNISDSHPGREPGSRSPWDEYSRADDLCADEELGIEGIIRMEAGFELILCDFTNGLKLQSARQRPSYDQPEGRNSQLQHFEYMRGIAARYHGITAGRVVVDYSSMVSAYFYSLNLTNPDEQHSEQPRLFFTDAYGIRRLKQDVQHMLETSETSFHRSVDWQGVVDMIVTRYSDRLQFLSANETTQAQILSELQSLLTLFIEYEDNSTTIKSQIETCAAHYLQAITPSTTADTFLHEALLTVTHKICSTLFQVRGMLLDVEEARLEDAKDLFRGLTIYLDWTTWLECGKCAYDKICYVASWPFGAIEDHYAPRCKNVSEIQDGERLGRYWEGGFGGREYP